MVKATRQMAPMAQTTITTPSVDTVGAHFSMGQAQSQLLGKASFRVRGYILVVGLKSLSIFISNGLKLWQGLWWTQSGHPGAWTHQQQRTSLGLV
jgi:hypothetical protein